MFKLNFLLSLFIIGAVLFTSLCASVKEQSLSAKEPYQDSRYQTAIANLMQRSEIQSAFNYIVAADEQNVKDLITLTEIPAPPFGEHKRAAYFAQMLKEVGLTDITTDEVGNIVARRPGTVGDKTIAIGAHIDTVFPLETDVKVRKAGDKLVAPGIGDNTRGLVVLLSIAKAMASANLETKSDILFVGNVGEEGLGDLRGVKHLFRQGAPKIDAYIAIDGGSNNRLIYGGVGSHRYRLKFKGPGGHSWGAFGMANPHHALGRAIAIFDETALKVTSSGEKTSYNIGRIGGGTSINSIPFESWAEIDMRSGSQQKLDEIDLVLRRAVKKALAEENNAKTSGDDLDYELKRIGTRPAGLGNVNGSLVQHAMASMTQLGYVPKLSISSTDANIPISLGIPAITISRGGLSGRAHSLDEWWQNKDSHLAIQLGLLTLLAEAGLNDSLK